MNSDEKQGEEDNFKCPGCPGFGSYRCCQTYGDYNKDYLQDLKREEEEE